MNRPESRGPASTFLALFGLLLVGAGLLGLAALVMPNLLGIIGFVFAMVFFGLFHYVTWGRWLSARRARQKEE